MQTATDPLVTDATYLASLLVGAIAGLTLAEVAGALKDPRNYPSLTALQMGQVLKANGVFPQITSDQLRSTLQTAGYAQADIDSATTQLFPPPRQYRTVGPAGVQANPFDDTEAAKNLGQPLTKVSVHSGNIIDSIQAFYGSGQTALPSHGGAGGTGSDILFDPGDALVEVAGFYGLWFGANYILQLTLHTRNGKVYGPYGDMQYASTRTLFSLKANANEQAIAFFGSTALGDNGRAQYLGSIGVTVQAN